MDIKLLNERLAQWDRHNQWVEKEDPARLVTPQNALRWADDVRDFIRKYNGTLPERPENSEGIRTMHERLARIH